MSPRVLKMKNGRFAKIHSDGDKLMLCAVDRQTIGYSVNITSHHLNKTWIAFTFNLIDDDTNYILQANKSSLELVESKSLAPLNQSDQVDGNSATVWFEKDRQGRGDYYKVRVASHPQQYICIENSQDKQIRRLFISDDENARAEVEDEDI